MKKRPPRRAPSRIRRTVALCELGLPPRAPAPLRRAALCARVREQLGPALGRHLRDVALRRGTATLLFDDPAWARAAREHAGELEPRLAVLVGKRAVAYECDGPGAAGDSAARASDRAGGRGTVPATGRDAGGEGSAAERIARAARALEERRRRLGD